MEKLVKKERSDVVNSTRRKERMNLSTSSREFRFSLNVYAVQSELTLTTGSYMTLKSSERVNTLTILYTAIVWQKFSHESSRVYVCR